MPQIKNRYRIVTDSYLGYEAQVKYWWWPFCWFQIGDHGAINTSTTVERAEKICRGHYKSFVKNVKV